jgi:hypothetical protein
LPGNPFARSPRPFEPSGADDIPPITYPGRFPPESGGTGPVATPTIPGGYDFQSGSNYRAKLFLGNGTFARNSGEFSFASLPVTTTTDSGGGRWKMLFYRKDGSFAGSEDYLGNFPFISSAPYIGGWLKSSDGSTVPLIPYSPPTYQPNYPPETAPAPQPLPSSEPGDNPVTPAVSPPYAPSRPLPRVPIEPAPLPQTAPLPEEIETPDRLPKPDYNKPLPDLRPAQRPLTGTGSNPLGFSRSSKNGGSVGLSNGRTIQPARGLNTSDAVEFARQLANPQVLPYGSTENPIAPVVSTKNGLTGVNKGTTTQPAPNPVENPNLDKCTPTAPTQGNSNCRYDSAGIAGKCDNIINKLEENYSLEWNLPECETDFTCTRSGNKSGQGLGGIAKQIESLYEAIKVLHDNTRCSNDPFLVVPDSWPMKVESGRPQLVLIYADKNKDKTWGSRRYEFCIPHFDSKLRKALKTLVPKEIKKGSHQGTYTLTDNSKIITYCKTRTEALRVLDAFDKLVVKGMRTNNKKPGEINPNTKFLEVTLYPYEARYFSEGQHKLTPDWKDKLY